MGKIKWIVAGLIVLVIVAVLVVYLMIDGLAKVAVEEGATYALDVDTSLDSAHVGLLTGSCSLSGLNVANPEGYQTPRLMNVGDIRLDVVPKSLLSDTVQVRRFEIDAVEIYVEQKGVKSNVAVILDNLKRLAKEDEEAPEQEGKRFLIDRILITNVQAKLKLLPIGGEDRTFDVAIPRIEVENVTSDNAKGVAISQIVTKVVPAILLAVVKEAGDLLPAGLADGLKSGLGDLAGGLEKLTEGTLPIGGDLKKGVDDVGKKIGEGLGGLFQKNEE